MTCAMSMKTAAVSYTGPNVLAPDRVARFTQVIGTASPPEKSEGRQRWRRLPSMIRCPIKQVFLPTFGKEGHVPT